MASIVVIGAGPGLGTEIGRRFGREGYEVVLGARNLDRLERTVKEFAEQGITAHGVAIDVADPASIQRAFARVRELVGVPDVQVFNPRVPYQPPYRAAEIDAALVERFFGISTLGAIRCTAPILPEMLARGSGALIYSVGGSALHPFPMMAPVGVATAGARNYAQVLHAELAPQGVFAGCVTISARIEAGTPVSPESVAETYWSLAQTRDRSEAVVTADAA